MVLSIIDIETTGGSNGNFVTEFACFQLINGEIRDNFSSLVKPPVAIPPFIQKLTGITHEMVQDAPTFEEIAPQIFDFIKGTSNSIFPASFRFNLLTILPLLSIIALVPLLADLSKKVLFSIALKIDFAKCWSGPIVFPNHPSSEILIIRFVSEWDFLIYGTINSLTFS